MSKEYPEKAMFMGHTGTHMRDGIYKVDEPYWVDIDDIVDSEHRECGMAITSDEDFYSDLVLVQYFCLTYEDRDSLFEYVDKLVDSGVDIYSYAKIVNRGLSIGFLEFV